MHRVKQKHNWQRVSANYGSRPSQTYPSRSTPVQQGRMAYFNLTSKDASSIPESPAAKRQKVAGGYQRSGYNSADDSGDDLFEGIETDAKHFTQPTQIIDVSAPRFNPGNGREEILVPASSPFAGSNTKSSPSQADAPGRLASLMAPAGTAFKAPNGIQKAPAKPK